METKSTDATLKRPNDHLLDAPTVHIDLPAYFSQLVQEPSWKESERNSITVFKTEGLCIVLSALHSGATLVENSLESLLSIHVLNGRVKVDTSSGESFELKQNQVLALHKGIPHTLTAISEANVLLTVAG